MSDTKMEEELFTILNFSWTDKQLNLIIKFHETARSVATLSVNKKKNLNLKYTLISI